MRESLPLLMVLALASSAACSERKAEPTPTKPPAGSGGAQPTEARPTNALPAPLTWSAPAGWAVTESSDTDVRRAGYAVPKIGSDKEDAEILALHFGKGPMGERDAQWDPWFEQFDGDAKGQAGRSKLKSESGLEIETFEFFGNYKLNVGKQRPGMKKSPVQMVKKDFRMIGAFVKTPDRGNWFFRLVGPDETVRAAKEPFLELLKTAK